MMAYKAPRAEQSKVHIMEASVNLGGRLLALRFELTYVMHTS